MAEIVIKVEVPLELKDKFEAALARVVKDFISKVKFEAIKAKLYTKEEQELIKWSIDLGRRAKKGRFKKLLEELSPEKRVELLSKISSVKREKFL
ncbi:MAG: hypothetical protein AABW75_01690 [Nanoarchaeota archaeon]